MLSLQHITRVRDARTCLDNISFDAQAGKVHGILGEADSGKSSIVRILGGIDQPSSGEMMLQGRVFAPKSVEDAMADGVAIMHQDLQVFPGLSIAENIFIGELPTRAGVLNKKDCLKQAAVLMKRLGIPGIPLDPIGQLRPGDQKFVELARCYATGRKIMILDEPSSLLNRLELERMFSILHEMRDEGLSIILATRSIESVLRGCDSVSVVREGILIKSYDTLANVTMDELLLQLIGSDFSTASNERLQRLMRGIIHNLGTSATVTSLAQKEALARLEEECLPIVNFLAGELLPQMDKPEAVMNQVQDMKELITRLQQALTGISSTIRSADERLEHIGSFVEMQQMNLTEFGTVNRCDIRETFRQAVASSGADIALEFPDSPIEAYLDNAVAVQLILGLFAVYLEPSKVTMRAEDACITVDIQGVLDTIDNLKAPASDLELFLEKHNPGSTVSINRESGVQIQIPLKS